MIFESNHVLNLIWNVLRPTATLSTYYLNDPRTWCDVTIIIAYYFLKITILRIGPRRWLSYHRVWVDGAMARWCDGEMTMAWWWRDDDGAMVRQYLCYKAMLYCAIGIASSHHCHRTVVPCTIASWSSHHRAGFHTILMFSQCRNNMLWRYHFY